MNGYAYACGYTVHWFKNLDAAAAAHQKDLDLMIAGEYPPNCVGPLERCTAAEAQDWASSLATFPLYYFTMPDPTAARRQRERYARKRQGITWEPQLCSGCQRPHRGKHGGVCHECWEATDAGKAAKAERVRRSRARKGAAAAETTKTTTGNA
jgi:hypothetical protein